MQLPFNPEAVDARCTSHLDVKNKFLTLLNVGGKKKKIFRRSSQSTSQENVQKKREEDLG